MHYEDEARGYNYLLGFVAGAVMGAGLALIAAPWGRSSRRRRLRTSAGRLNARTRKRIEQMREAASRGVDRARAGRQSDEEPAAAVP
jgi:gas vesicle protein